MGPTQRCLSVSRNRSASHVHQRALDSPCRRRPALREALTATDHDTARARDAVSSIRRRSHRGLLPGTRQPASRRSCGACECLIRTLARPDIRIMNTTDDTLSSFTASQLQLARANAFVQLVQLQTKHAGDPNQHHLALRNFAAFHPRSPHADVMIKAVDRCRDLA